MVHRSRSGIAMLSQSIVLLIGGPINGRLLDAPNYSWHRAIIFNGVRVSSRPSYQEHIFTSSPSFYVKLRLLFCLDLSCCSSRVRYWQRKGECGEFESALHLSWKDRNYVCIAKYC